MTKATVRRRKRAYAVERLEQRWLLSATWSSRGPGGGGAFFSPSFSPFNSSELYTVSDMSGLYHSTDTGQTWTMADSRQIQGGIASQVQFTSDPSILYTLDYSDTPSGGGSVAPSKSTDGGKTWKQVAGWNGANDQAYSIFADPQNTTSLLVTDYGGLYFSSNGGQSFTLVYTDPSSGQGCYVGGVFWDGSNVYVGVDSGLIVSTNGGTSFSLASVTGLPAGSSILSFAGAKQNNVTRLAGVTASSADVFNGLEMGSISSSAVAGIWTLTPGQSSWTKATAVPAADDPFIVSMALNDINTIYVGGTNINTGVPIIVKSTNGGQTFSDVLNVASNANVATGWQGAGGDRGWSFDQLTEGFQVSPANSSELAFTGFGFIHISTDGGATWRQAYVNPADQNPAGSNTPKGKAYHGIGLEDTSSLYLTWADSQTIIAGYTDIYGVRSTDGGASWSFPTGFSLSGNTVYCVAKQGTTFYAATSNIHDIYQSTHVTDSTIDGGTGNILYSTNNGATWQVLSNLGVNKPVIWIATDPTNSNRMYASVVNSSVGGIYVTNNLSAGTGATWTKVTNPPRTQGHAFNIDVLNDGTVVATFSGRRANNTFTDSSGVFLSTDAGATWSDRTGTGMHWWTKDLTIDPTDSTQNTWYASVRFAYGTTGASGTGGLYRTTDRGQHWTQIFQSIGAESAAVSPTTGAMFVATEENGLYFTANPKAATPVFTQTSYPFRQPERIFFNPFNANEVWVTSFGYGLAVGTVPQADLYVAMTGGSPLTVGKTDVFTIVITNNGPSDVTGATLADTFSNFSNVSFIATALYTPLGSAAPTATPASGTLTGTGPTLAATLNMPAGSIISFTVTATVAAGAPSTLVNTATITNPAIDPVSANNTTTMSATVVATSAEVIDRTIFYRNSFFDGNNSGAPTTSDFNAIAPDKVPLMPGQTASFSNVSNFSAGIDAIFIDIAGVPIASAITASDFEFTTGNTNTPGTGSAPGTGWASLATAPTLTLFAGKGVNNSDRFALTWPAGTISGTWLQVTVKGNASPNPDAKTGLAIPDVFYFASAPGESGNSTTDFRVNATDEIAARNDPHTAISHASIADPNDFNRDSLVNANDEIVARNHPTTALNAVAVISVPGLPNGQIAFLSDTSLLQPTSVDKKSPATIRITSIANERRELRI